MSIYTLEQFAQAVAFEDSEKQSGAIMDGPSMVMVMHYDQALAYEYKITPELIAQFDSRIKFAKSVIGDNYWEGVDEVIDQLRQLFVTFNHYSDLLENFNDNK